MNHVSGGWGIVCADWVNHPEVGPDELALLALLSLYAAKDGTCWPSQSTLADRLKRSRSWVIRVLNILEATGLVTRSQRQAARGRRATCLYTLVGHAEAVKGTPLARSGGPVHNYHVASHRVAGMEQEHRNPAIAGLSRDPHRDSESPSVNEQAASADRRPAKGQPPEDWTPSPADRAFAAEHAPSVDVDCFARLFVESCRSHGYRYVNHSAAFRTWLLNCGRNPMLPMPTAEPIANALGGAIRQQGASPAKYVALPIVIRRLLPSISWLMDTPDAAVQYPDEVTALSERVDEAMAELSAMQSSTDPAEVVMFLSMMAERRNMALPAPSLLAMDARAIAAALPADLWPVACDRLWSTFSYRRLPECPDFLAAVADELAERREAAAKIQTAHLKVRHLRVAIREATGMRSTPRPRSNFGSATSMSRLLCSMIY